MDWVPNEPILKTLPNSFRVGITYNFTCVQHITNGKHNFYVVRKLLHSLPTNLEIFVVCLYYCVSTEVKSQITCVRFECWTEPGRIVIRVRTACAKIFSRHLSFSIWTIYSHKECTIHYSIKGLPPMRIIQIPDLSWPKTNFSLTIEGKFSTSKASQRWSHRNQLLCK